MIEDVPARRLESSGPDPLAGATLPALRAGRLDPVVTLRGRA